MNPPVPRSAATESVASRPHGEGDKGAGVSHPFALAFLRADIQALAEPLSEDIELDSPVITRRFRGKSDVVWLLSNVMRCVQDPVVTDQLQHDRTLMLAFRTASRGRSIQGVHLMRLDEVGLIRELTVHMRPLSGLTAFASAIGPALAGERSPGGLLLQVLGRPFARMAYFGDRVASAIVFASRRSSGWTRPAR